MKPSNKPEKIGTIVYFIREDQRREIDVELAKPGTLLRRKAIFEMFNKSDSYLKVLKRSDIEVIKNNLADSDIPIIVVTRPSELIRHDRFLKMAEKINLLLQLHALNSEDALEAINPVLYNTRTRNCL